MRIVIIGASGTIGSEVSKALDTSGNEIIKVGRKSGDFHVDITSRESIRTLYKKIGSFDALVNASGEVAFAPFSNLTAEQWQFSFGSKLLGQIQLVQEALPFIKEKGSFTLISGVLSEDPILSGVAASTVNSAVEGFVRSVAIELPKGLRINVISPNLLKESESALGSYFPGTIAVEGWRVAQAFKKSVMGAQTGQIYRIH